MNRDGTTTCPYCGKKQSTRTKRIGPPKLTNCTECGAPFHPRLRTQ